MPISPAKAISISMRTLRVDAHTVTAWAEPINGMFQGLASISPKISDTWSGGPQRESLIIGETYDDPELAEITAFDMAILALATQLNKDASRQ